MIGDRSGPPQVLRPGAASGIVHHDFVPGRPITDRRSCRRRPERREGVEERFERRDEQTGTRVSAHT